MIGSPNYLNHRYAVKISNIITARKRCPSLGHCLLGKGGKKTALISLRIFFIYLLIHINVLFFGSQLGDLSNPELRVLTDQIDKIRYVGK